MNARNAWLSRLALVVGMLVGNLTPSVLAGELPIEDLPLHDEQITPVKVGEFAAERSASSRRQTVFPAMR